MTVAFAQYIKHKFFTLNTWTVQNTVSNMDFFVCLMCSVSYCLANSQTEDLLAYINAIQEYKDQIPLLGNAEHDPCSCC
jgi:hypothetical protein